MLTLDADWAFGGRGVPARARIRAPWHEGRVTSLVWSPDGRAVCSAGRDGAVRVWDVAAGELRWQFERRARLLAVTPDGTRGFALAPEGAVWPFDLTRGEELERLWAPPTPLRRGLYSEHASVSGDGRWLFPACDDGRGGVVLVDLQTAQSRVLIAPGAGELQPVGAFTADARSVVLLGGVRPGRTGRVNPALYRYPLGEVSPDRVRALRTGAQRTLFSTSLHRDPCCLGRRWFVAGASPTMLARWPVDDDLSCDWIDLPTRREGPVVTGDHVAAFVCERGRAVGAFDHVRRAVLGVAPLPDGVTALALSPDEATLLAGTERGDVCALRLR